MPSTPMAMTSSKKLATRFGSAPSNSVQLIDTRKPRAFALRWRQQRAHRRHPDRRRHHACWHRHQDAHRRKRKVTAYNRRAFSQAEAHWCTDKRIFCGDQPFDDLRHFLVQKGFTARNRYKQVHQPPHRHQDIPARSCADSDLRRVIDSYRTLQQARLHRNSGSSIKTSG